MKIEEILKYYNIDFVTKHPEISNKCIAGVCCPFCEENNYHIGVFKNTGSFSCWKCGEKGSLFKLINKITGISYKEFQNSTGIYSIPEGAVKENLDKIFQNGGKMTKTNPEVETYFNHLILVATEKMPISVEFQIDHFLMERKFTYEILERYCAMYGIAGYFKQRLVIPIFDNGKTIGLVGRDLTGVAKNKYLFNSGFKAGDSLYIASSTKSFGSKIAVVVEGVFDAWAVSTNNDFVGVATFGSNISTRQLWKLADLTNNIVYMPDADVPSHKVLKTKNMLSEMFDMLLLQCPTGDPCSLHMKGKLKSMLEGL